MKLKKRISLILTVLLALSPVLLTAGCGEKTESGKEPPVKTVEITLSIDYPKSAEMEDVKAVPFKIEEGSSALETIELYCNVNEMPVAVEITGGTVIGINDLLNGDVFANRTWKYMVNGELMEKSARKVILEDGDSLEWIYTK
ncbi:MAG: DUF4430 domain-containing protein [Emergencia sp.]|nr:DUF4430 domain-containing protein [Emergencia sp.]